MDWLDLAKRVGAHAPLLGTLLGGPAGGAVGALIASALGSPAEPEAVSAALANPEAITKLREIEAKRQVDLQAMVTQQAVAELQAATANASDVNRTMQVEATSNHWPSYSWRPAIGFSVALAVALSVLTVFVAYGAAIFYARPEGLEHLPGILGAVAGILLTVSPILGIASWFRGKAQADPLNPIAKG